MMQRRLGVVFAAGLLSSSPPALAQKADSGALWASRFGGDAQVVLGSSPLTISNPNRMPYRDARDNAICIAPESLVNLGIVARVEGSSVKLMGADKNLIVVAARQGPFERAGGVFVDAVEVLKTMGIAALSFEQSTNTLILRSVLRDVSLQGDALKVTAGLPVTPSVSIESQGLRVVVDFPGATIGELPRQLGVSSSKILAIRTLQADDNTARLVIDLSEPIPFYWREGKAALVATLAPPGVATTTASTNGMLSTTKSSAPTVTTAKPTFSSSMVLRTISTSSLGDDRLRFALQTTRMPNVRPSVQKGKLVLDFGNIYLADSAKSSAATLAELKHPLIKSAQLVPVGGRAVRLLVELASQVGYTIRNAKGGGLLVDLLTPRKTEGPLAGRTIVVDPGHGGSSSSGNRADDGILEKNLTLPIGLMVAQNLEAMGANVILTRDSDFDPGLEERAIIANRANADIFVSVHLNDGRPNRSVRGIEVYYHRQEETSRDLARFIGAKIKENVGGALPLRGARSDSVNAPEKGYAILRSSQMTGVLVELGYMSNSTDYAALKNSEVQRQAAQGIAEGIADYFAANPSSLTKYVKPQKPRDFGLPPLPTFPDDEAPENPVK